MQYKIVHDMPGRIRLRCGKNAFSKKESYAIESELLDSKWIYSVKTSYVNGNILIYYKKSEREFILNKVKEINLSSLTKVESKAMEIEEKFKKTLFKMVKRRFLIKTLMPAPLKPLFTIYRSMSYIKKG